MNFKPSGTYKLLLIQANALASLVSSMEAQRAIYMERDYLNSEKRLLALEKDLESEKEMNAILTNELEHIERII